MIINTSKDFIKRDLNSTKDRKRNFNKINTLYQLSEKNEFTIDDQTWDDLIMNEVFYELDRTYSTEGEAALYKMLRNPIMDEEKLKQRGKLIDLFKDDLDLTVDLRRILYNMIYDSKNKLLDMLNDLLPVSKLKSYIYSIAGIIPILLILAAIIFKEPNFMIALMVDMFINMYIHNKEESSINAIGLVYLRDLINASNQLSHIKNDELKLYTTKMKTLLNELSSIDKSTYLIKVLHSFGGILEMFSIPFLIEESTFYRMSIKLVKKKEKILELYYLVGELDALISIALYENNNEEKYCIPKFIKENSLKITDGIHPLIKNPVANSLEISKKGIVLTGTNMSGKSTFLRMISTNILLAQTFNFALAHEYKGCFLNLISSISPKDDITSGKSYYLAEAESILRIIKASEKGIPVFSSIDEIFRGTNPAERISSSAEILNYINKRGAICIVATHDRELSDILKENYDFYYFSEDVDNKNGLKFDYKLKKGISKTRNAIKLLDYIGYPKEIVLNSYRRVERMEEFI
ncbi:MutS-related protein [Clostridium taeniosporum]|uniref:DNA mismatch repair protein MutS n=1 Tax=Clostridium taeniosporum TaxID=394958 RepID=A0A1D7XPK7_9CLOT|nr:DNA mismatch repair protein MutS [Clostridium taeniosporum]AOR25140.1 DNA mismatch repair protein MutS [Clostridium taeniosporum]